MAETVEEAKMPKNGDSGEKSDFASNWESEQKNGSGSWIRTSDQVVNSHLLYR